MQPDRWDRIKTVFGNAVECPREARERVLEQLCADDAELRAEIESLLAAHDTSSLLDRPAPIAALAPPRKRTSWIGRRMGPYRIMEEVGSGGMGEVYRAARADDEYDKEVAIKVLRADFDTTALLQHFRIEKQILATLDHPNIARLLDAGSTEEGQPFIVMDFICGKPIDEYCKERGLGEGERLQIFRALCGAVHYVHQRLMVHGDLKCSNILVTENGAVKLLDFGIARLLNAGPMPSPPDPRFPGWLALTPEYASPERIRGQPTTTASDVYSLGVVLHQLLTGSLPNAPASAATVPLRGELGDIVMMALQNAPQKRYSSAEHLSEDVRRYLTGLPVLAHGASVGYQARKFVGRHWVSSSIAALLLLSLVGGMVATSWQAHVARVERARAERHAQNVRKLADTLLFDVQKAIANLPGSTGARQTLVANSLAYLDALAAERADDSALRRELASAYEEVGDVQGTRIGDNAGALASYRKALAIREALVAAEPDNQAARRDLVRSYGALADMVFFVDDVPAALAYVNRMVELAEAQARATPSNMTDRRNLGVAYGSLGWFLGMSGDVGRGLPVLERAISVFADQVRDQPDNIAAQSNLGIMYLREGHMLLHAAKRYADAERMSERAVRQLGTLTKADPLNSKLRQLEGYATLDLGSAMARRGAARAGLEQQLQAVKWLRMLHEADTRSDRARFDAARALSESGETLVAVGEMELAEQHFMESLRILAPSTGANAGEMTVERALMAFTYFHLGRLSALRGAAPGLRGAERTEHCRQALDWLMKAAPLIVAAERSRTWYVYVDGLSAEAPRLVASCTKH